MLNNVKDGSIVKPAGTSAGVWAYVLKKEEGKYSKIVLFDDDLMLAMEMDMPNKNNVFTDIANKRNVKSFITDIFEFEWKKYE